MLEVLLTQLRHNTIGCSFVQVGSRSCHPASSHGYLPNLDLMDFLSSTTFGACLTHAPEVDDGYDYSMNIYHHAFLTWGFHKSLYWSTQTVLLFSTCTILFIYRLHLFHHLGEGIEQMGLIESLFCRYIDTTNPKERKRLSSQLPIAQRSLLSIARRFYNQRGACRR